MRQYLAKNAFVPHFEKSTVAPPEKIFPAPQ